MLNDISTIARLTNFADGILAALQQSKTESAILGLKGDLGVGKTTFVQLLAGKLGVTDTVTSPTYLIMRSYPTTDPVFKTLVHIDAYRIEALSELGPLRLAEVLEAPHTLVCIEWADKIAPALPDHARYLTFTLTAAGTRSVEWEG